jgi:hypothetical protein
MEPEDEAFEELALKQGHWQHTSGWRKKQIMETSMKLNEIIEMAQECGLIGMRPHLDGIYSEALEAFAKLVTQHEREACAKMVDHILKENGGTYGDAIRARGQA